MLFEVTRDAAPQKQRLKQLQQELEVAQERLAEKEAEVQKLLADKLGFETKVAEAAWSGAEWAVAPRFDNPRATVLVLLLG